MIVSINQPAYLPWLGYFHRIAASDIHVVLDHVQFEKNSYVNRNKVQGPNGPVWLTVPILTKGRFGCLPIHSLEFAPNESWRAKHWKTLSQSYSKAPFFSRYAADYQALYSVEWPNFLTMCLAFLDQHLSHLGINTPLRRSSDLGVGGTKSDLVLNLCKALGASTYLSGSLGREYLDAESFGSSKIKVVFQDYTHPIYSQRKPSFSSHLCILDLLFGHGPDSLQILTSEQASL